MIRLSPNLSPAWPACQTDQAHQVFSFSRSVISDWPGWRSPIRMCTWLRKWWHSIIARRKSWWARDTTQPRWTCGASAASSASCCADESSSRPRALCNKWVDPFGPFRKVYVRLESFFHEMRRKNIRREVKHVFSHGCSSSWSRNCWVHPPSRRWGTRAKARDLTWWEERRNRRRSRLFTISAARQRTRPSICSARC